jgi:hypothetical protein
MSAIDLGLAIWFASTAVSVAYIAYDLFTRTPEMKVMKWGWVLVALYTGPVALAVYWFSCREPAAGTHETFVAPLWKQSVGSTIHCLAGDATGIIVAASITLALKLPTSVDSMVEYGAGFGFGLLVFQALFMKDVLGGTYGQAVRKTWLAEWMSMNGSNARNDPRHDYFNVTPHAGYGAELGPILGCYVSCVSSRCCLGVSDQLVARETRAQARHGNGARSRQTRGAHEFFRTAYTWQPERSGSDARDGAGSTRGRIYGATRVRFAFHCHDVGNWDYARGKVWQSFDAPEPSTCNDNGEGSMTPGSEVAVSSTMRLARLNPRARIASR